MKARLVLIIPCAALLVCLFVVPQAFLFAESLSKPAPVGLDSYVRFFSDSYYVSALLRTFAVGISVTAICVVCGFTLAFWLARMKSRLVPGILLLTTFPLFVSSVVRNFGWMVLFFRNGLASEAIRGTGLVPANFQLMGTFGGVVLALGEVLLPLMVLTIYPIIRNIDPDIENAAMNLGASPFATMLLVTLPLARKGILAGSLLVLSLAVGAFATPSMIGGVKAHLMAVAIQEQTLVVLDWPFAAAMGMILLVISIGVALTYSRLAEGPRA